MYPKHKVENEKASKQANKQKPLAMILAAPQISLKKLCLHSLKDMPEKEVKPFS